MGAVRTSYGLLGVIVEVTVKLLPTPRAATVVMASFDDVAEAGALLEHAMGRTDHGNGLGIVEVAFAADAEAGIDYVRELQAGGNTNIAGALSRGMEFLDGDESGPDLLTVEPPPSR